MAIISIFQYSGFERNIVCRFGTKDDYILIFTFPLTDNIEKQKKGIILNGCNQLLFFEAFFPALKKIRFCSSANQAFGMRELIPSFSLIHTF